jgi:hypothetical protein
LSKTNDSKGAALGANIGSDLLDVQVEDTGEQAVRGGPGLVDLLAALDITGVAVATVSRNGGGDDESGQSSEESNFGEHL